MSEHADPLTCYECGREVGQSGSGCEVCKPKGCIVCGCAEGNPECPSCVKPDPESWERMYEALKAISDQGFESKFNGQISLLERCDFDCTMARWGLGIRKVKPEI